MHLSRLQQTLDTNGRTLGPSYERKSEIYLDNWILVTGEWLRGLKPFSTLHVAKITGMILIEVLPETTFVHDLSPNGHQTHVTNQAIGYAIGVPLLPGLKHPLSRDESPE